MAYIETMMCPKIIMTFLERRTMLVAYLSEKLPSLTEGFPPKHNDGQTARKSKFIMINDVLNRIFTSTFFHFVFGFFHNVTR